MTVECPHCNALLWSGEPSGMCCHYGKVHIPVLERPPEPLASLLLGEVEESEHFLSNFRRYNAAFQMTSMGCKDVTSRSEWNPCYKIQGAVCHKIGSLCPAPDTDAEFAQIYFVGDENIEATLRQNVIPGLKDSIIRDLQAMLHRENSYVRALITSHEILSENFEEYKIVINADQRPIGEHSRIFNAPDCNEIAVLMVGEEHGKRDIVLRYRDDRLQRIAETHRSYDPLQYPLLFSRGENGYCFDYKTTAGRKITCMKFYSYRLMVRAPPDFNTPLRCRRSMQQYVVDMYVKVETERLAFIRAKQKELRADSYSCFTDALTQSKLSQFLFLLIN